jgi:hypothetical protein
VLLLDNLRYLASWRPAAPAGLGERCPARTVRFLVIWQLGGGGVDPMVTGLSMSEVTCTDV